MHVELCNQNETAYSKFCMVYLMSLKEKPAKQGLTTLQQHILTTLKLLQVQEYSQE